MPPKKQNIVERNKIEKFLLKSTKEAGKTDADTEEWEQQITEIKNEIAKLLNKKRELECLRFPKSVKLKDIPINYDNFKFENRSSGVTKGKLRLKFHEYAGSYVSKSDDKELVVKFDVLTAPKVYNYAIRLNKNDGEFAFSKCFVPPMIKIRELIKEYPIAKPRKILNVISTACQVYHDVQNQIDHLKEKLRDKDVEIFNSVNNRLVMLDFQMVQRSTETVFPVQIAMQYEIYYPRPISISIKLDGMASSVERPLKKQCKYFNRYSLWNAFEIISNVGIKKHESVFYLLQSSSEFPNQDAETIPEKIKKSKSSVNQILRDFNDDEDNRDEDHSSLSVDMSKLGATQFEITADIHMKSVRNIGHSASASNSEKLNAVQNLTPQKRLIHSEMKKRRKSDDSIFSKDTVIQTMPLTRSSRKRAKIDNIEEEIESNQEEKSIEKKRKGKLEGKVEDNANNTTMDKQTNVGKDKTGNKENKKTIKAPEKYTRKKMSPEGQKSKSTNKAKLKSK